SVRSGGWPSLPSSWLRSHHGCGSLAGRDLVAGRREKLGQSDIDDQPEPEGLEEMKDRALSSVQESQQDNVSVKKIAEGAGVQREAIVLPLQPQDALVRGPEQSRRELPCLSGPPPLELLLRERFGVAEVLLEVKEDLGLLQIVLQDRAP